MTSPSKSEQGKACVNCRELEERLENLELERQDLLLSLARERERANAIFLAFPPALGPPPAVAHASSEPMGPLPLRYRLVDAVNDSVKRGLPGLHLAAKKVGPLFRGRRK